MRFLLVDRIRDLDAGRRIAGAKLAAMSEDYFEWHFPERPIVPGMLILESMVQLAGWLEAASSDFERWILLERVRSARYYHFAGPGDVLEIELGREETEAGTLRFSGESRHGGRRGAVVEFEGRAVPLADLEDPAALRRTYAALRGEAPRLEERR